VQDGAIGVAMDAQTLAGAWFERVFEEQQIEALPDLPDIVEWAEENFYIIETARPIVLMPHQKDVLRLISERNPDGTFRWRDVLFSTIKKSGKTTVSALYARWAAECWGPYQEVYNMGNKLKQAKERAFKIAKRSIELAPSRMREQWDLQATKLTHLPSGSYIEALPIAGAGEAGGNQSLTVWTELWGFQYDDALLMWDEMKPVPTRPLSQRFVDTYAGFKGVSELLFGIWERGLAGERLHGALPVWGNQAASLIAYIDQGEAARRMPWQIGEIGKKYYSEQAATEEPATYKRHHENEWQDSLDGFIEIALWDRLEPSPVLEEWELAKLDVVIGVDAAVSGDCTAISVVAYDRAEDMPFEVKTLVFDAPKGGKLDYDETLDPALEAIRERYRVVCVAYDEYQLHQNMTSRAKEWRGVNFYAFPQGSERLRADTDLRTRIRQGEIMHRHDPMLRSHVQNAAAKASGPGGESAIRIVKREARKHVDGLVAFSMAAWKATELLKSRGSVVRRARAEWKG
jgi:phage terminase large subunit-like protein